MPKTMYRPKNTFELAQRIKQEIKEHGAQCDLNHIDVSHLTSLEAVFMNSDFNGDISRWDVSNVTKMSGMFQGSQFKGDVSTWRPVALKEAYEMFRDCPFHGDLSGWDVPKMDIRTKMLSSPFLGKVPNWLDFDASFAHWYDFKKNHPSDFRTMLAAWDGSNAIRPAIVLAILLSGTLLSEKPHCSVELARFCEQYETVALVIESLGVGDVLAKFDMAAIQMSSMRNAQPSVSYTMPFETT